MVGDDALLVLMLLQAVLAALRPRERKVAYELLCLVDGLMLALAAWLRYQGSGQIGAAKPPRSTSPGRARDE